MILIWNSAAMTVTLSLVNNGERFDYEWEAGRTLARDMLAYLRDRLKEHNTTFTDLTGIAVYQGPGSFTGLRIGLTVLNTIADSSNIPIVGSTGGEWESDCLERLYRGENDRIVLPEYGGEAHITKPRK